MYTAKDMQQMTNDYKRSVNGDGSVDKLYDSIMSSIIYSAKAGEEYISWIFDADYVSTQTIAKLKANGFIVAIDQKLYDKSILYKIGWADLCEKTMNKMHKVDHICTVCSLFVIAVPIVACIILLM